MLAEHGLPEPARTCRSPPRRGHAGDAGRRPAAPARRLLLATALSAGLHVEELEAIGGAAAVDDALDAGVLRADGDRVRAAHPLLAAAARQPRPPKRAARSSTPRSPSRSASRSSARCTSRSPRQQPDAELAAEVETAAARASARGARPEAVALAEQALRLTPPTTATRRAAADARRLLRERGRASARDRPADARVGFALARRARARVAAALGGRRGPHPRRSRGAPRPRAGGGRRRARAARVACSR